MDTTLLQDTRYHQSSLWDGLTERGNLTHRAIRHIENVQSELWGVCEVFLERQKLIDARSALAIQAATLDAREARLVKRGENLLRRCMLQFSDLRHMRPVCSSAEVQERADSWRDGHLYSACPSS